MNKSDLVKDEQIRAFAAKQKISTPKSYSNRVLLAISEGKNRKFPVRRIYLCRKAAIASICLCILMAGGVGVHAAIDYAQKRMEQISDTKKQHYLESLNGSMASADSFSRMLTEKEKNRMDELAEEYRIKGIYPNQSILEISNTSEIVSDRICFLPSTSTFYLPENNLTDEQLLELIDFYNIRENTLNSQQTDEICGMSGVQEITEENAVQAAKEMLKKVFNVDIDSMEVQVDYQQGTDGEKTFSTDYIYLTNIATGEKYSVTVNLQNGRIEEIEAIGEVGRYSNDMQPNESLYIEKYASADKMAKIFLNNNNEWKSSKILYYTYNSGKLENGIVSFDFIASNGESCIVSFSQSMQQMYKIRFFSEKEVEQKERDHSKHNGIIMKSIIID